MQNRSENHDSSKQHDEIIDRGLDRGTTNRATPATDGLTLDAVERLLPIPDDVLISVAELPSGDAWWVPSERVILIRAGMRPARRNVTLAHETAHILLGHGSPADAGRNIEREADFLAEVLLLGAATSPQRRRAIRSEIAAGVARRAS